VNFLRPLIVDLHRQGDDMGVAVIGTGKAANADAAYIEPGKTLRQAGHLMRELGVAALVVRAESGEVRGSISRDMVVRSIAAGGDPKTVTVGEVASGGAAHRHPPARLAGAGVTRRHHSPDPSGHQLNCEEIGPGTAWPGVALTADELTCAGTLARNSPGLVA
jgi:CBS domain-containing protein